MMMTICLLAPRTRAMATRRVSGSKWVQSTELDVVNGSICNLCALGLWLSYISLLHSADESQQGRNSCPLLRSCLLVLIIFGVSKLLAVYYLYNSEAHE